MNNEHLNILLLGSGGREAALAWKLSLSPRTGKLYVAPGNAGTAGQRVADLNPSDFEAVMQFAAAHAIDMIVVGPEHPLVDGIYDYFKGSGISVIGPSAEGARLEGSKEYAKEFMARYGIPTARFMSVTADTLEEGKRFLESLQPPYVLKADGLAAGKGVLILNSLEDAKETLGEMLGGMFGRASSTVVIEEFLDGIECSVFVVTDGQDYKLLPVAKDYKRVGEGNSGLNTGGMGAVSPVPFADHLFMERVVKRIVEPTLKGLGAENIEYKGFIFLGLMAVDGEPYVIEYNVRMGDPETEVVIPRITSDLVDLLDGVAHSTLAQKEVTTDSRAASAVMLVSEGYPLHYEKGKVMTGFENVSDDVLLFHAGTATNEAGEIITSGGRVLAVTAYGDDIYEAARKAKEEARKINYEGRYFRSDISNDL